MSSDQVGDGRPSRIPILRALTEADRPEVEALIDRLGIPRQANANTGANEFCSVVERDGKITAVALGNTVVVGYTVLLIDPSSPEADGAHDGALTLEAILGGVKQETAPGALVGLVVLLPTANAELGKAIEREGLVHKNEQYATYFGWNVNSPSGAANQPTTSLRN